MYLIICNRKTLKRGPDTLGFEVDANDYTTAPPRTKKVIKIRKIMVTVVGTLAAASKITLFL
jgi:hypothetical protein